MQTADTVVASTHFDKGLANHLGQSEDEDVEIEEAFQS